MSGCNKCYNGFVPGVFGMLTWACFYCNTEEKPADNIKENIKGKEDIPNELDGCEGYNIFNKSPWGVKLALAHLNMTDNYCLVCDNCGIAAGLHRSLNGQCPNVVISNERWIDTYFKFPRS